MFLALLSDAKDSVEKDTHVFSSSKADAKEKSNIESKTDEDYTSHHLALRAEEVRLLEKCSEYLFDLFEANLTPEYRRLSVIQERAIACFNCSLEDEITKGKRSGIVEYTFEQQNIHEEFKDVFEQLIGDFLFDEKMSVTNFFLLVEKCAVTERKNLGILMKTERQKKFADEILDTIYWYTDFECWASAMRAEASYRRNMKLIRDNDGRKTDKGHVHRSDMLHNRHIDELDGADEVIDETEGTGTPSERYFNERLL